MRTGLLNLDIFVLKTRREHHKENSIKPVIFSLNFYFLNHHDEIPSFLCVFFLKIRKSHYNAIMRSFLTYWCQSLLPVEI